MKGNKLARPTYQLTKATKVDHLTNKQQKVHRRSYGRGQKLQALKSPLYKDYHLLRKRGAESTTGFPEGQYDGEMEFVLSVIGTPLLGHLQSSQCYEYLVSEGFHVE